MIPTRGVSGAWAHGAGTSGPVQPGTMWGSSVTLPPLTASWEAVVSSVATDPSISDWSSPAPGPAGAGGHRCSLQPYLDLCVEA